MPANYYKFKRENVGMPAARAKGDKLLTRTHDVRLLILLAKFALLDKDLFGFARRVGAMAWLLQNHWADAHPRAEGGEYTARLSQLGTLDDPTLVIRGVKYATLIEPRARARSSFRAQLVATGRRRRVSSAA